MENLRASIIQTHLVWENKLANLEHFEQYLKPLKGKTDLIILPEMFTTGFSMNPGILAETMDGPTMNWLSANSKKTEAVITGSFIAKENNQYYNRLVWMQPDGKYYTYDKRHLFTLAKEHEYYSPGTRRLIVELKGWKIHPLICYDLRFPVWSRNVEGYDLLIYMANWPEMRSNAWKTLLIGRAIENQSYTIGVNRIGDDANNLHYTGDSSLIDYGGKLLYQATDVADVFTVELAKAPQDKFRSKLAFLADRDTFSIL